MSSMAAMAAEQAAGLPNRVWLDACRRMVDLLWLVLFPIFYLAS